MLKMTPNDENKVILTINTNYEIFNLRSSIFYRDNTTCMANGCNVFELKLVNKVNETLEDKERQHTSKSCLCELLIFYL